LLVTVPAPTVVIVRSVIGVTVKVAVTVVSAFAW
jgi:hypothetical protein